MILRDKWGWPVETFRSRPVTNFIRYCLHTSIRQTINYQHTPNQAPVSDFRSLDCGTTSPAKSLSRSEGQHG